MRIVTLLALVACSKAKPEPPAAIEHLITETATSVMRMPGAEHPLVGIAKDLIDPQPCWTSLLQRTTTTYQVLLTGDSYFIAETNSTRDEFETCFKAVFKPGVKLSDDDGMLSIDTPVGVAHALWRGNFVVFGRRAHVVAAKSPHDPATVARWQKLMPAKPLPMAMASIDKNYTAMMGDHVSDWFMSMDKVTKDPMFISGTFIAHYDTPADADKALAYIKDWSGRGRFPVEVGGDPDVVAAFDGFAASIGKLTPVVKGNELTIAFDSDKLGGPLFFAGVLGHFDKLQGKLPAK